MIQFDSPTQMLFCILLALLACICFVGGFYNPAHFFLSAACIILIIATYKCW